MVSVQEKLKDWLLFDSKDYALLNIVNDVLSREDYSAFKHLLTPFMHSRGINEMAASQGLRIAYAAANLLGSLELGKARDRIVALRALYSEVLNASVTYLRRNTARVLLQIMKELVRSRGDEKRQLELAHDFRMAATGKPRIIARQLKRYHLVPMPEDWVQICFDNHVHDANTKGRKSATHLIMDAWIKGIRSLTVIYYNFVLPDVAEELLQAAEIMGITVRIGIEFHARFQDKRVKLIWVPRGFSGAEDFLNFLREPSMATFMEDGRNLSKLQEEQILHVLREFNANILHDFNAYYGISMEPLTVEGFFRSVGAGQASLLHLGKHIHSHILPHFKQRVIQLQDEYNSADKEEKRHIEEFVEEMNYLDAESVVEDYLETLISPDIPVPKNDDGASALYCPVCTPSQLIDDILKLRVGNRFILNLQGLTCEDVLELLFDADGRITHLEVVNLKNFTLGSVHESARAAELLHIINSRSVIPLKRWIMDLLAGLELDVTSQAVARKEKFSAILENIFTFHEHYRKRPLRSSIGSDSTGQSCRQHGMGVVAKETLSPAAQKAAVKAAGRMQKNMTVGMSLEPRLHFQPRESPHAGLNAVYGFARRFPSLRFLGYKARRDFFRSEIYPTPDGDSNLIILGGVQKGCGNELLLERRAKPRYKSELPWEYLNSHVKNTLKVLMGFIPAMLSFMLTKEWWVLQYFGAVIWFSITGLRNIIQSVLGGGGVSRTPLLKWNDYVSWGRLAESLLYTGLSVPLLDYFVKTVLLDHGLGITVITNATALYTIMGLVNGCYISGHNLARGLPKQAAFWNLFRSVLSIPLAMAFSAGIGWMLSLSDPVGAGIALQQWAAVISKLASDCVAGVIEGLADRENNMKQRIIDYKAKIEQMLSVQERLEILFPKLDVLRMLEQPKEFMSRLSQDHKELESAVIVNSLDYLSFWMCQPRGRSALKAILREMKPEERKIFLLSQYILLRKREISQLFLDGLLGKNFSKGLAFYLDYSEEYLEALQKYAGKIHATPSLALHRNESSSV